MVEVERNVRTDMRVEEAAIEEAARIQARPARRVGRARSERN